MPRARPRSDRASRRQDWVTRTASSPPHQWPGAARTPAPPGANARDIHTAPPESPRYSGSPDGIHRTDVRILSQSDVPVNPSASSSQEVAEEGRPTRARCAAREILPAVHRGVDGVRPGAYGEASSNPRSNVVLKEPPTPDRQHPGIGLCLGEGSAEAQADPPAQPSSPARDPTTARRT